MFVERCLRVGQAGGVVVVGAHGEHEPASRREEAGDEEQDDEDDDDDPTDGRSAASLRATLERPSMALAPREAGLHLWPHDSIGGVNERSARLPLGRDDSTLATCDGRAATADARRGLADSSPSSSGGASSTRRRPGSPARLATGRPIAGYIGFDPSADSLHVGHLVPIFGLLRLQRFGGRPVALVGGGTGMIGDPSGRSAERNLLDRETLEANVVAHPRPARAVPRLRARRPAAPSWSTTSTGWASCR